MYSIGLKYWNGEIFKARMDVEITTACLHGKCLDVTIEAGNSVVWKVWKVWKVHREN
jgi:hypothetical protein